MERNDPCWCQSGKKWKKCHFPEIGPISGAKLASLYRKRYGIILKKPEQIIAIRKACRFSAEVLARLCEAAKPGVTTEALDQMAFDLHRAAGAKPAPLGYGNPPYPKSICTSINDVICHGIPDLTPLQEGDILNIDVSSIVDGFYGDCSAMVIIGQKTTPEREKVVIAAKEALDASIAILKPNLPLNEIANTIEDVAKKHGCSVVSDFVGHGIGLDFHEPPQVLHAYNSDITPLAPGMTFTIEPMINGGRADAIVDKKSGWIVRTIDGKPSAQWEHTLLITEDGVEILTLL